jgi:hypothetical protein
MQYPQVTLTMMDWVRKRETSHFSVERLKGLYAELIIAVDLADDNNLGLTPTRCRAPTAAATKKNEFADQ